MSLRTVRVKVKSNNQTIDDREVILDPDDDLQVRNALLTSLDRLGEDPAHRHRIQLYTPDGVWIRELRAA